MELARHCNVPPDWFLSHHPIWRAWAHAHMTITRNVERNKLEDARNGLG